METLLIIILTIWLIVLSFKLDDCKVTIDKLTKELNKLAREIEATNLSVKLLKQENTKEVGTSNPTELVDNMLKSDTPEIKQENITKEELEQLSNISENTEGMPTTDDVINYEYIPDMDNKDIEQYRAKYTFNSPKVKKGNDFESFFLGNAFTVVGAIALIMGVGIFMTLIYSIVTPLMKTILGFIFGLCLIAISHHLGKSDNLKKYSEVLMGTGFSALFITTLCTTVLYKTFTPTACIFVAGIILTLAYVIADKQKTISMIAISLIGGYLNIFFASQIGIDMTFGYIIFLNLLSTIYVYRNPDKELINIINLIVSLLVIFIQCKAKVEVNFIYPIILWLVYLIFDLVKNIQNKDIDKQNILNWVNLGVLTFFSLIVFKENKLAIGITLISMAMVYNTILAYLITKNSDKFKPYLYSMLVTILLSFYFLLDETTRISAWSLFGLLIAFVVKKLDREYLTNWSLVFFAPAITNLFLIENIFFIEEEYTILFNNRLLAFAFPTICTFVSYLLLKDMKGAYTKKVSELVKFVAISLTYLFCFLELNNFINNNELLEGTMKFIPLVIVGFIYTLQMKKLSMTNNISIFNIASYVVGLVSLTSLLIAGSDFTPIKSFTPIINTRVLAFITAIGTSICFAKWTKSDVFKYLATILGFILITFECFDCIDKYYQMEIEYIVSIAWLTYSGIITTIGIIQNKSYLKNVGIITSILAVMRILFYDLRNLETLYKLFIFTALGAILMIVSYLYNKNKK